ncbi:hypothetical protein F2Q69_00002768 [Brassica cretica]|uniref:Uncharacterized protein n=1 Tax=Brassica cretica TaxID=69181 RepID=A0A8S9P718_BRACR|nr:hypothetical protein F2Q69_00002768 [Brassica cretica]
MTTDPSNGTDEIAPTNHLAIPVSSIFTRVFNDGSNIPRTPTTPLSNQSCKSGLTILKPGDSGNLRKRSRSVLHDITNIPLEQSSGTNAMNKRARVAVDNIITRASVQMSNVCNGSSSHQQNPLDGQTTERGENQMKITIVQWKITTLSVAPLKIQILSLSLIMRLKMILVTMQRRLTQNASIQF